MQSLLIVVTVLFLAYANGANDNFKGVATLFGSGTTEYKTAIGWATITTFAGSIAAIFYADRLVKSFSGRNLVPDSTAGSPGFLIAVVLGTALTVIVATILGFPVSTTHGIIGALIGSGLIAKGSNVNPKELGQTFLLPLLVSPVAALICASAGYYVVRSALSFLPQTATHQSTSVVHFLSSGALSFARGMNDTPKIVAALLVIRRFDIAVATVVVAAAMGIGGLLNARRVAFTMSKRITTMSDTQGLTANVVTSALVILATLQGLPVSTTHVSCGSLFGIGLITKRSDVRTIQQIMLAWIITLPAAAVFSAAAYTMLSRI
jgi:inorganic phosphate transporter, PiT family